MWWQWEKRTGAKLKIKRTFNIETASIYSVRIGIQESSGSGRSPNSVLIRRQRQWTLMRKERGTIVSIEGKHFYWCT